MINKIKCKNIYIIKIPSRGKRFKIKINKIQIINIKHLIYSLLKKIVIIFFDFFLSLVKLVVILQMASWSFYYLFNWVT